MFGFIKKIFLIRSSFLSSVVSTTPLSCISMINQACKVRPEIINIISNDINNIGYITIKKIDDYENVFSVNPLYLLVNHASGILKKKMKINT